MCGPERRVLRRRHCAVPARSRGFSLVEVVIITVIIGILASVTLPRFWGSIAHHQAVAAGHRLEIDLTLARRNAMMTNVPQTVTFTVSSNIYTLNGMAHPDNSEVDYAVNLAAEPYLANLISADVGGDTELIFDIYGLPDSSGLVVVRVGNHVRTVTVDAESGKASTP